MDKERYGEQADEEAAGEPLAQAECGMCGEALDPTQDDLFVELCRTCEHSALKTRQTRGRVPESQPRRLPAS